MTARPLRLCVLVCLLLATPLLGRAEEESRGSAPRVQGLEPAKPPVLPTSSGNLLVVGERADLYVPPGSYVDLILPRPARPLSVRPTQTYFIVDDRLFSKTDVSAEGHYGVLRLEGARLSESPTRRVRAGVMDDQNRAVELLSCAVRSRDPGLRVSLKAEWRGETVLLTVPDREKFKRVYLYWDREPLGALPLDSKFVEADTRTLAPGKHPFYVVAEAQDGTLLPCARAEVTVQERFQISAVGGATEVVVPETNPGMALPIRVVRSEQLGVKRTRVYLGGVFVGESEKAAFDMAIPLRDTPSGTVPVEAIGIGADGVRYPMETLPLRIKNEAWESRIVSATEYPQIKKNLARLAELEPQAAYWVERAAQEPSTVESTQKKVVQYRDSSGRTSTITYLNSLRVPTQRAEYKANARKYILQMAQVRLETARLYRRLGMWEWAEQFYRRTMRESAPDGSPYAPARQELEEILARRKRD